MKIEEVWAREILDSRGNPTVEVDVVTENGFGSAAAPSGASTGSSEAVELRDGGERYLGKGVRKAVKNVNSVIAPELEGLDVRNQGDIDNIMLDLDGTSNKSNLGANALCATSMAILKAAASSQQIPLFVYLSGGEENIVPQGMFNVLNGGEHAGNNLSIQEFMIVPQGEEFSSRLQAASEIYHILGDILEDEYGKSALNVGDEGGYAPPMSDTREALDILSRAIEESGYEAPIALDAAASSFYSGNTYLVDGETLNKSEFLEFYRDIVSTYDITSVEDPFHEDDFESFARLNSASGIDIVGDDLTVTNPDRIRKAIDHDSISTLLLKINQIGTVTESLEAAYLARKNGLGIIVSHRSGETEDPFIADFATGINAERLKSGAPARGERTSKYNQLLRIEEKLSL